MEVSKKQNLFFKRISEIKPIDVKGYENTVVSYGKCCKYLESWKKICDIYMKGSAKLQKPQVISPQSTDDWVYINNICELITDYLKESPKWGKLQALYDKYVQTGEIDFNKQINLWTSKPYILDKWRWTMQDTLLALALAVKPSEKKKPWCDAPEDRIWKPVKTFNILKMHSKSLKTSSYELHLPDYDDVRESGTRVKAMRDKTRGCAFNEDIFV